MKKIIIGFIVLILLGFAGFKLFGGKKAGTNFRTQPVTRGEVVEAVTASGTINPVSTVLVGTQVSGRVLKLFADFNSVVKQGQTVAQIDPAPFQSQVEQARANLLQGKANVEKAEAQAHQAEVKLKRAKALFAQSLVSQDDMDTAQADWETNAAQVNVAKAQLVQAEASLQLAKTNLEYTNIQSPVDGMVVSRNVDVGQTVAASFQTPTLFNIARDLTKMQIDTSVGEADIGKISMGEEVTFTVDAYPDQDFQGGVTQVRNAPTTVQNVVTYDVVITVENPDLKLKPGMTANTSIITSRQSDVLRVPNAALRFKYKEARNGKPGARGPAVWILENGKPKRISVKPGISDGTFTAVTENGLKEGQEVIVDTASSAGPQSGGAGRLPHLPH
jgi:HlyD family secretion protein